jgi:hypothetical protein
MDTGTTATEESLGLAASGNDMCKIVAEIFFARALAVKRKLLARNNKNWMRVFR